MWWLKSKKIVVVHDGNFHPDDVFCVALLSILNKGNIKVIRTRDEKVCFKADYVLDVGGEYDSAKDRFDHHQSGGAGLRENKIPYSTFGLLWKKYGREVCQSKEIADIIDKKLVQTIDADDNGFNLYQTVIDGVMPFTLNDIIYSVRPNWKEGLSKTDSYFTKAVSLAKEIILREIKVAEDKLEIVKIIRSCYDKSSDKRLIIIDEPKVSRYDIWDALQDFPEPLFIIYEGKESFAVVAMRKSTNDYRNRKDFPQGWGGLRDGELAKITGVSDAVFCHIGLFLAVAKSKEGAIKLAQIALNS